MEIKLTPVALTGRKLMVILNWQTSEDNPPAEKDNP